MNNRWGFDRAIAMLCGMAQWLAAPASAGFRNHFVIRDLEALSLIAVSYTHLTLPTIYSV